MRKIGSFEIPLIQPLEPRRLMSLTAGFDAPPTAVPPPPPPPLNQPSLEQPSFASETNAEFPPPPLPAAGDPNALDAQFAHAISQGTPIILTPETLNPDPSLTGLTSISDLYGTLGTSTVSAIDSENAASTSHTPLDDLFTAQSATDAGKDILATGSPTIKENSAAGLFLSSAASSSQSNATAKIDLGLMDNPAPPTQPPSNPPPEGSLVSRALLQSLQQELHAVRTYSRELAWNIGRDRTIELAHAQPPAVPPEHASSDWNSSASVITAAIASIVYAERELVRGKKNLGAIFSNRLLRT